MVLEARGLLLTLQAASGSANKTMPKCVLLPAKLPPNHPKLDSSYAPFTVWTQSRNSTGRLRHGQSPNRWRLDILCVLNGLRDRLRLRCMESAIQKTVFHGAGAGGRVGLAVNQGVVRILEPVGIERGFMSVLNSADAPDAEIASEPLNVFHHIRGDFAAHNWHGVYLRCSFPLSLSRPPSHKPRGWGTPLHLVTSPPQGGPPATHRKKRDVRATHRPRPPSQGQEQESPP